METIIHTVKIKHNDFQILLEECRKKDEFTDIQLKVRGKLFPAHRAVLSLYSPVLKAMISDQWSTTKICSISDEYVDAEIMENLLSFLYTGNIDLTPDNVHPVCVAAHFLQIPKLLKFGVAFLCELISVENVLKLFLFSVSCQIDQLQTSCLQFVITNYVKVFQDPEILDFRFENFKNLLLRLKENFWGRRLREHTFDCIVRWTGKNPSERLEHLPILLENISLVELPVEFLEQTLSTHPLVKESVAFVEILSEAIAKNEALLKTKDNFVVAGRYETERKMSMFSYDLPSGHWKQLPKLEESEYLFHASVVDKQDIIVARKSTQGVTKIDMFDWITQTWNHMTTMPYKLHRYATATLNDRLFIAGILWMERNNKKNFGTVVASYSFDSKQWRCSEFPDRQRLVKSLIPYQDHLYAIGWNCFEKYDPERDRWTALTRPETGSHSFAATLHQDQIYLCSIQGFEVYDPVTDCWISLPAPVVGTTSLMSVNDKLLAVGGRLVNDYSYTDLIYEFDLNTQQWTEFGKLPLEFDPSCCVAGVFY